MRYQYLFVLALCACFPSPISESCEGWYFDGDGDGFGEKAARACDPESWTHGQASWVNNNADCDDSNAQINPHIHELCDGVDNNCDGEIDEGLPLDSWPDNDHDGFGDRKAQPTCIPAGPQSSHRVNNDADCDDDNPQINPHIHELCDGVDNNCDARIDEGLPLDSWFDGDGDGFGDPDQPMACARTGWVGNADDCDDEKTGVSPDAVEKCDGADNNCDGQIDEGRSCFANLGRIAVGAHHSCALRPDDVPICWGTEDTPYGWMGDFLDAPLTEQSKISSSIYTTCAVDYDGGAICWGRNAYGERDVGKNSSSKYEIGVPGGDHACALTTKGEIECWGKNACNSPPSGDNWVSLASNENSSCALDDDGYAKCWRCPGSGYVGWESTDRFIQVDTGYEKDTATQYACGITQPDASIRCWALNPDKPPSGDLLKPPGGNFRTLATGNFACAIRVDQTIVCWGENKERGWPTSDGWVELDVGRYHACAMNVDNKVACWGKETDQWTADAILVPDELAP